MNPGRPSFNLWHRPRWLTHREQLLLGFILAILVVGGIVSQVRNIRPEPLPEHQEY